MIPVHAAVERSLRSAMEHNFRPFITKIIKHAGRMAARDFKLKSKIKWKTSSDPVTETDVRINKYLFDEINKEFPGHNISSEELPLQENKSEYTWFVDPVDGTINFVQRIPFFGIIIGLAKGKEIIEAAIYNPIHDELFYAQKGQGAFSNDKKIISDARDELSKAYVDLSIWPGATYGLIGLEEQIVDKIYVGAHHCCIGLTAGYIAIGRIDATVFAGNKAWDTAGPYTYLSGSWT